MTMTAWEVPDVAWSKVFDFVLSLGVDDGYAAVSFDDVGPLRCVCMPVQLAQSARLEIHIDTGEALRDRKVDRCRLIRATALVSLHGLLAQLILDFWHRI